MAQAHFAGGQKKTLPKLLDRDKTKNKHYEQTLIFGQTYKKRVKKVPRFPGAT